MSGVLRLARAALARRTVACTGGSCADWCTYRSGLTGWHRSQSTASDSPVQAATVIPDSQHEETTAHSPTPHAGGTKVPPKPQEYIILGAKSSRMIPRLRRPVQHSKRIKVDDLDEQRRQLLVFTREAPLDSALENIDRMKPVLNTLSAKRYEQLNMDLKRSFAVPQLKAYIKSKSATMTTSGTKAKLVDNIMKRLWSLTVSDTVDEGSDLIVERTIQLSRRELFVIISQNARLPRKWTNSGASIIILSDEQTIIVRSTANICHWVMASLHRTLQSIVTKDIDYANLAALVSIDKVPLARIQRMSNTFLHYKDSNKILAASALQPDQIEHAERLLVHSTGYMPRTSHSYLYDSESNQTLSQIVDDESLTWNERGRTWFRLRAPRSKTPSALATHHFDRPVSPEPTVSVDYDSPQQLVITEAASKNEHTDSVVSAVSKQLIPRSDNSNVPDEATQVTVTASFGYLLHDSPEDVQSAYQSTVPRTFMSNVPSLYRKCSLMPLYNLDVQHDSQLEPLSTSNDDAWEKLFSQTSILSVGGNEPAKSVKTGSKLFLQDDSRRFVQIKLVPSLFEGGSAFSADSLAPVEMWLEVDDSDKCDPESLQLISADAEVNAYLSQPRGRVDVKFTTTKARFLQSNSESIDAFLSKAHLDMSGKHKIYVPHSVELELDGRRATYLYQSLSYRRQVDLAYNGHILQLAQIESGGFGGRRVESNLVLDVSGDEVVDPVKVESFIKDALTFAESL